jgi:hypothetical protein
MKNSDYDLLEKAYQNMDMQEYNKIIRLAGMATFTREEYKKEKCKKGNTKRRNANEK